MFCLIFEPTIPRTVTTKQVVAVFSLFSPEVSGQILLFQAGGNREIWHKDACASGEFELIGSNAKIDSITISVGGGGDFRLLFISLVHNLNYITR